MHSRVKLFLRSLQCYFGIYFPRCFATREINTKITLSRALKLFATRVHTLISITVGLPDIAHQTTQCKIVVIIHFRHCLDKWELHGHLVDTQLCAKQRILSSHYKYAIHVLIIIHQVTLYYRMCYCMWRIDTCVSNIVIHDQYLTCNRRHYIICSSHI